MSVIGLAARKDCGCVCVIAVDDGDLQRRRDFYRDAADGAMAVERVTIEQVRTMLTFCKCGQTGDFLAAESTAESPLGHLDTAK